MAKRQGKLNQLLCPTAVELLSASGKALVERIGADAVRQIVYDVLCGVNLRDSTEVLTRRRIAILNLALVEMFVKGAAKIPDFVEKLPSLAADVLQRGRSSKPERSVAQWALGLTDKGWQNVLRDDMRGLQHYLDAYVRGSKEVVGEWQREHGELTGRILLPSGEKSELGWLFFAYLLNSAGAETLTIRGSEKSAYGKLFEKLVLGSVLEILGFRFVQSPEVGPNRRVFWLSSPGEKRESDATLLYEAGKGVRFDIGFIGRGNPEISLDKVTRFEREISLGHQKWYLATVIIVDRIGAGSRIRELARQVDGTIVQMSLGYWPQDVARVLKERIGYGHELASMEQPAVREYLWNRLKKIAVLKYVQAPEQGAMGPSGPGTRKRGRNPGSG